MSDPSYAPPPADHRLKITHLVFGLLFLGAAGTWALGASGAISGEHLAVLAPALLIGAGVIGLAASLASGRNRRHTPAPYVESPVETRHDDTTLARTTDAEPELDVYTDTDTDTDTEPTQPVTRPTTGPTTGPQDDHTEETR